MVPRVKTYLINGSTPVGENSRLASAWYPGDVTDSVSHDKFWALFCQALDGWIAVFTEDGHQLEAYSAAVGTSLSTGFRWNVTGQPSLVLAYQTNKEVMQVALVIDAKGIQQSAKSLFIMDNSSAIFDGIQLASGVLTDEIYMSLVLLPNGTMLGTLADIQNNLTHLPYVAFLNSSDFVNFSAMAMTGDRMFYGLWDDTDTYVALSFFK
ncbi:hypothetical protein BD289DRAFT_473710 [Coniella lustricola]|uniref:Uncharacterized protein n=1 Tax=Coniella lustricola TaxID=2025994 RepID=A0A2T3AAC8_9PEZI|nr:hypothetical protein BD289DRAFT_473710 [Coniella lustricola]